MLFSVIIPTHNRATLLREALESVFTQEFTDFEIIVVDDGSTDETAAVVSSFGDRIRFFRQDNKGPGAARNLGIRYGLGDYVAFLDSDDVWFPWTLETAKNAILQNHQPAFIVGQPLGFHSTSELRPTRRGPARVSLFADYLTAAVRPSFTIVTCSAALVSRTALHEAGAFIEQNCNGEDSDMWLQLGTAPGFVVIEAPATCGYRRHSGSVTASLRKTYAGLDHILTAEVLGAYPGGETRGVERRPIITRHVRPASLALAQSGAFREAIDLYSRTLRWHLTEARAKYLVGFWFLALRAVLLIRRPCRSQTVEPG